MVHVNNPSNRHRDASIRPVPASCSRRTYTLIVTLCIAMLEAKAAAAITCRINQAGTCRCHRAEDRKVDIGPESPSPGRTDHFVQSMVVGGDKIFKYKCLVPLWHRLPYLHHKSITYPRLFTTIQNVGFYNHRFQGSRYVSGFCDRCAVLEMDHDHPR